MGDRTGFVWKEPESWGEIDKLVAAKWQRMKIEPSDICTDLEFIRRVYLDLTGLPPSPDQIIAFVDDKRETRLKRDEVIDKLIGSPEYVDYWANKWSDLLQCNSKFLGTEGAELFHITGIRSQVENKYAVRPVCPQNHDGNRIKSRKSRRELLEDSPHAGRNDGEHHATVSCDAVQLQQMP